MLRRTSKAPQVNFDAGDGQHKAAMILPLHNLGDALVHVFQVVHHNALRNVSKAEDFDLD